MGDILHLELLDKEHSFSQWLEHMIFLFLTLGDTTMVPTHFQHSFQDYKSIELWWCCVEFGRGDLCATLLGNQTSLFWRDWFMDLNPPSVALDGRHLPSHQSPTSGVMHSCYCIFLFLFFKRLLIVVIIKNNSPYLSYAYKHIPSHVQTHI